MAFTGSATIKQIADNICRITGLSLAAGASGVIGLTGKSVAPDVTLPSTFVWTSYAYEGSAVTMQDAISCDVWAGAVGVATAIPVAIVKTGTTKADFAITLTNTHGSLATPNLEIYVKIHLG